MTQQERGDGEYEVLKQLQQRVDRPLPFDRSLLSPDHPDVTAYVDAYLRTAVDLSPRETQAYRENFLALMRSVVEAELPTPYEDIRTYGLLMLAAREIESVARKLGLHIGDSPGLGTIWSHEIQGQYLQVQTASSAEPHSLIVIDSGVFTFFSFLLHAAIRTLREALRELSVATPAEDGFVSASVAPDDDFYSALAAYLRGLTPREFVLATEQDRPLDPWSARLEDGACMFVVGHEYGHLLCQHGGGGREDDDEAMMSAEIDADRWAMTLALGTYLDRDDVFLGAVCFLSIAAILEDAYTQNIGVAQASGVSSSHPPVRQRLERLYDHLRTCNDDDAAGDVLGVAPIIEDVFEQLWISARERLVSSGVIAAESK